jgi:tripartite-type tricarboxylate transporter receptor subunit TctC
MAHRWITSLVIGMLALSALPGLAAAEYPDHPIRIIVPFSAGGAVDGPMRVIAQELGKRLGQAVYVENKPGAGATIGSDLVAKAPPDGYTLLLASQTNAISASLYSKLAFNPVDDFAPISLIGREQAVLAVTPSMPVNTVQELIAYANAHPGEVNYASSGNGSGQHLMAAMFASMAGIKMTHVPYRGSAPAMNDVIGGRVPVVMPGLAGTAGLIKSGQLRALAVSGTTRSPQLPDVPTLAASGLPQYSAYIWMGLLAPKGTPRPIIDKLNATLAQVLQEPQVKEFMAKGSIDITNGTPEEFDRFFREEKARWAAVIKETGAYVN